MKAVKKMWEFIPTDYNRHREVIVAFFDWDEHYDFNKEDYFISDSEISDVEGEKAEIYHLKITRRELLSRLMSEKIPYHAVFTR